MAFSGTGDDSGLVSDINVTPLVDVMLVLLVIFMVTVPALVGGVNVDLPKTREATPASATESIVISITRNGDTYIGRENIRAGDLPSKIQQLTSRSQNKNPTVFLRADRRVPYGEVVRIMSNLRGNGITRLSLITEPEQLEGQP